MLELADIPFFESLSPDSLEQLQRSVRVRDYSQGSVIVREGDPGQYFQAIADGAVWVQQADRTGRKSGVFLGPGQIFGEMSLFSGMPVSATLIATKDTKTYCFDGEEFLGLLDAEPLLHKGLVHLLMERLRNRARYDGHVPGLIILAYDAQSAHAQKLVEIMGRGILHHSPGAEFLSNGHETQSDAANPALKPMIERWRDTAPGGHMIVLKIRPHELAQLSLNLEPRDVVLQIVDCTLGGHTAADLHGCTGVADFARAYIGTRRSHDGQPWAYQVMPSDIETAETQRWDARPGYVLDKIARYLTFKEIGIAMSSGAARGFAHLGVLEVMAAHGIPYDALCGSSMGGIVALTVARKGNIYDAREQVREQLGSNRKIRDPSLIPRGSLFSGHKIADAARATFGECTFADLNVPTAVVAADLASRERVIFDRGRVAPAVLATSAIPGFFPPVVVESKMMVDGGVVSWVPVDVLEQRRCGLRIAINVLPLGYEGDLDVLSGFANLKKTLRRPLGLKSVLGASWELLGSWGSSNEALKADMVITPKTPSRAGYDFDRFDELVQCGRDAALESIEAMAQSVHNMLRS